MSRMKRAGRTLASVACLVAGCAVGMHADVKTEQKGQVRFAGALGTMFNMFGGKAAKEGVITKVAIKGDRMLTSNGDTGQLVDLNEEKVYEINFKDSSYRVITFEEMRRRMREAEEKARQERAKAEKRDEKNAEKNGDKPPEYEVDVTTRSTGATKAINGYDTKQAITTVTVRPKGKTVEQGGGMVLTADSWLAPGMDSIKELVDFQMRYMKKLDAPMAGGVASADQMAAAFAMYPMLKDAMAKMRTEGQKVEGTPVLTTMTFDAVQSPEQQAQARQSEQQSKPDDTPASVGGLGGLFAKKMMKKKAEESAAATPANTAPGHTTVMTMVSETLSMSKDVSAADVSVPAGFKEKK
jgi:hypothetical protein